MKLSHFDHELFLRDYWQKQPLLIRNPWDQWHNPLDPDELAGFACEDSVESRLVICQGERPSLESGPLPEERFGEIADETYTLLVQAVDQHVPAVAALIEPFRFVPDWRIDDVMVSYAVTGGGVGPHFDQYDVFLIQGLGRRRWRVGPVCDASTPLLPHDDLRLLADFETVGEWDLEPGDILYVPPGVAHDGIALSDDCMTYSVGFRAPSLAELVEGWSEYQADSLTDEQRYTDPGLTPQVHPGEIEAQSIDRLHAMVLDALGDRAAFARWFAAHASQPKYPDVDWRPEQPVSPAEVRSLLADGATLSRNPASRFAFIRQPQGAVLLCVDGEAFDCPDDLAALAVELCDNLTLSPATAPSDGAVELLTTLVNSGALAFE
ncbi:MAG: cupin domain-containing protein [Pseudomonadota bacterium]